MAWLFIYIVGGVLGGINEYIATKDWKISLFVAIFYPLTMLVGLAIGAVLLAQKIYDWSVDSFDWFMDNTERLLTRWFGGKKQ